MKDDNHASTTAMMVAYMRALADVGATHVRDFHDPTAHIFLNEKMDAAVAQSRKASPGEARDDRTRVLARPPT